MTQTTSPEIGQYIQAGDIHTNYHDLGEPRGKPPVCFIHGSGPGVTSFANWRLVFPEVAKHYRVLGPDMVGFGYTERPEGIEYSLDVWVKHFLDFLHVFQRRRVTPSKIESVGQLESRRRRPH